MSFELGRPRVARSRTNALSARRSDHLGQHRWPRTPALCGVPVRPTPVTRPDSVGSERLGPCRGCWRMARRILSSPRAAGGRGNPRHDRAHIEQDRPGPEVRFDLLELHAQLGMTTPGPRASADVTDSRSSNGGDRRLDTKLGQEVFRDPSPSSHRDGRGSRPGAALHWRPVRPIRCGPAQSSWSSRLA
jgi:hypothetical protein